MQFIEVYLLFWIFSFFGWVMEVIVCSIDEKRIVNRGFLLGPYCPIYGCGGVVMLLLSPYKEDPVTCFILAMVICSVIEYIASYLMEKIFKVRWWDYSTDSFNLNGRICLRNSIAFGLLGMICTSHVNPWLISLLNKLGNNAIILLFIIIFIITTTDIIVSCNVMNNIKKNISKNIKSLKNRDATNDIKEMIIGALSDSKYLERRIIKAYRYFSYQKEEFLEKIDNLKNEVKKRKVFVCYGTICGMIITLILWLMTDNYRLWLTIFIPLGFFIDIIIYNARSKYDNK